MVKFAEAHARLFRNKFVCRECKSVVRTTMMSVMAGKSRCRNCTSKALRPYRKK